MRCNIYAEEITDRVEIITKRTEDGEFTGLRFYLELPISVPSGSGHHITHRGPFIHRPGDDDSSAVTFWGKQDMRVLLRKALAELDKYYDRPKGGMTPQVTAYGSIQKPQVGGCSSNSSNHSYDEI